MLSKKAHSTRLPSTIIQALSATCFVFIFSSGLVSAADWPTYRHDKHRSGKTDERLDARRLQAAWTYDLSPPAQPAWAGPAKWDAYAYVKPLGSMRDYDWAFQVAAAGGSVFFGSSVDDSVHCLDAKTGKQKWSFTTAGPVRIAPCVVDGRVYFGSDDGYAYCLDADSGNLVWKYRPTPPGRKVLYNGRLIPHWPCRTGVLVDQGTAYFAMGMLPWETSYLCAVDAKTGEPQGPGRYVKKIPNTTLEGALLATAKQLFVPQGRIPPQLFDRASGKPQGQLEGGGGCFVLLTEDAHVLHGPGNKTGWVTESKADSREKLASISGARRMVVSGKRAYLLAANRLAAIDRGSRKTVWRTPCKGGFSLILAGDVLFVGMCDKVCAYKSKTGELIWESAAEGRVHGLAVADGRLLASTHEGRIHCFAAGKQQVLPERKKTVKATKQKKAPPAISKVDDAALMGRWIFQDDLIENDTAEDLVGMAHGNMQGDWTIEQVGRHQALKTDGTSHRIVLAEDHKKAKLPTGTITATAWVRIDKPAAWGGIVGAFQDNGSFERGWLLGYCGKKLSFAVCGKKGPGRLTYLQDKTDYQPGRWYHVAGTYDGKEMRLFVDGKLRATSTAQKGDINYPPKAFYEIGAYHDKDEFFRLAGMINEVRVYTRALSANELVKAAAEKTFAEPEPKPQAPPRPSPLLIGPCLQFTSPDTAMVSWTTAEPSPTILEYQALGRTKRIKQNELKTRHEATLTGLRPHVVYTYTIQRLQNGKLAPSPSFECDTFFNYCPPPVPPRPNPYADSKDQTDVKTAQSILEAAGPQRGICLVLGCGEGRLVYELARQGKHRVIGLCTDREKIERARTALCKAGIYGSRAVVYRVDSLEQIPTVGSFANLVVCSEVPKNGKPPAEAMRLLQPGGVAILGQGAEQKIVRKAVDENGGVWSHQYGRADNSAYGGEDLDGARSADELRVQWIGRPGPRAQADRNGRKPSPLSVGGRLFMQGLQRIIAIDSYNGTILWSLETPQFYRYNIPRDCGNWCANSENLFAVMKDRCWQIDAKSGKVDKTFAVPGENQNNAKKTNTAHKYEWGYVSVDGGQLIGSAVRAGASFTDFWGGSGAGWYDLKTGGVTHKVCSDRLFSLDKDSGRTQWSYKNGLMINPTITAANGRIYFVECRNPKAMAQKSRRLGIPEFWQDQFMVALDQKTGKVIWEKPIDTEDGTVVFYLAYADDRLVLVSSNTKYHVYGFKAKDGKPLWNVSFDWKSDNHGRHMSRPAIVGGKVYVRPRVIDLATGKLDKIIMPDGGCGTYALTAHTAIFRNKNITLWDYANEKSSAWNRLRPGCWLSTIPAGGMILSPEAGGGCSCGSWLETSIGFIPKGP